jgi:hypothetical protein
LFAEERKRVPRDHEFFVSRQDVKPDPVLRRTKAPAQSLVSKKTSVWRPRFSPMTRARLITGETLYIDGKYHIID